MALSRDACTGGDGMNRELVETVAKDMCECGPLSTCEWVELEDAGRDEYRSDAMAAIKATGWHLLSQLEGSESPSEMRAKIAKECGL